jgi:hypothetical protein
MAAHVLAAGTRLRVGIGAADGDGAPLADALVARVEGAPNVLDIVRYEVGPSIGGHTGPGTAGAFFFPSEVR